MEERGKEESTKDGWALLEPAEGAAEKGARADDVARAQVVEGSGHLNEGLKKALFRLFELEPCALPMFMGIEELAAAIASKAFGEMRSRPVERHGEIMRQGCLL